MKNKADKEYVVLFIIALFFSVVVPILVPFIYSYVSDHMYELFGGYDGGATVYYIYKDVMKWITDIATSIAIAPILIIAIRYSFKWFALSTIPRSLYYIIYIGLNDLHTLSVVQSTTQSYMSTLIVVSSIIEIILFTFIPILWFLLSRVFKKLQVSESIVFVITAFSVVLLSTIQLNALIIIFNMHLTNILSFIGNAVFKGLISYIVIIVSYFLIKIAFKKFQKPIQIEETVEIL